LAAIPLPNHLHSANCRVSLALVTVKVESFYVLVNEAVAELAAVELVKLQQVTCKATVSHWAGLCL
jgi:hypothetical protein